MKSVSGSDTGEHLDREGQVGCGAAAEYEIWRGFGPDNYTLACCDHVGEMLELTPRQLVVSLVMDADAESDVVRLWVHPREVLNARVDMIDEHR